ncbi:hypothetical protein [Emticicia sp. BO119]|uniref:hypothetical protein n=1 Tax=Emticicia sp. BO119 TaxID=2757768 RepID=UPI0015F09872|nr:hypothetical protein [Emticicia sp. BO119]MBA4849051.1 hypothetical protein [Emticicia sp. BO119]
MSQEIANNSVNTKNDGMAKKRSSKLIIQKSQVAEKAANILPIWEIIEKVLVSISIIIPFIFLFVGGALQISELWKMNYLYIRFFSVTQLLSDSIIFAILFIKEIFLPIFIAAGSFYYFSNKIKNSNYFKNKIRKFIIKLHKKVLKNPQIIFKVYFINKPFILSIKDLNIKRISSKESFYIVKLSLIMILLIFESIILYFFDFNYEALFSFLFIYTLSLLIFLEFPNKTMFFKSLLKEFQSSNYQDKIFSVLLPLLFIGLFLSLIFILLTAFYLETQEIKKNFLPDGSLANKEKIYKIFENKYQDINILYFNDQYIFVAIENDTLIKYCNSSKQDTISYFRMKVPKYSKIEVLKFDKFFEEENSKDKYSH